MSVILTLWSRAIEDNSKGGRFTISILESPAVAGSVASVRLHGVVPDEMADILWVLICLANQTGVNLTEALIKNFEKKNSRDRDRHKNNEKLR